MKLSMMLAIGLSLTCLWLRTTSAQNGPVVDTDGNSLRRGGEYIIRPAISESGGPFTLISRTADPCPLVVGQHNVTTDGLPVTFAPYEEGEDVVLRDKNFKVTFSGLTVCAQSMTWKVAGPYAPGTRRLIATGDRGGFANYFYITRFEDYGNIYIFGWCPAELCPTCRFACGSVGLFLENGKRFFALDGNNTGFPFAAAFPVVFERVYYNSGYVKQA